MSTHHIANVIVASTNTELVENFSNKLTKRNYTVLSCDDQSLEAKAKTAHPDLILIDVSAPGFDGFGATEKLKKDAITSHIPVVLLAAEKTDDLYLKAHDVRADDIFIHSFDIEEFFIHIKPLLRLSTMYLELDNRFELAKSLGIDATNDIRNDDDLPYHILLIAPKDGDKASIETVLNGKCDIDICTSFFEAEDKLSEGVYDVCISNFDDENRETVLNLSSKVRNNPSLFNLPMIIIAENRLDDRMEAYRRGVTRIVHRPLNLSSLKAKVKMLVRRQRLRWNIRKAIETSMAPQSLDTVTQAYNKTFFEKNFAKQVENAHKWQKHLAVVFFKIPNVPLIEKEFGTEPANHLLQQAYQWIRGLTRTEDVVARYDNYEFCIVLPDTPKDEAQIVMHRIAGILSYTDFALNDVFQPISVWVECGITSVELGDDPEMLIKRARKNIN